MIWCKIYEIWQTLNIRTPCLICAVIFLINIDFVCFFAHALKASLLEASRLYQISYLFVIF